MKKLLKIFWMPAAVFLSNEIPVIQNLYNIAPRFDHIMHTLGGFAIAFMFYTYLTEMRVAWWKQTPLLWRILIIVSFVMFFGVAWEWYELIHDNLLGTHYQLSISDTMFDLLFDCIGSLIFSVFYWLRRRV